MLKFLIVISLGLIFFLAPCRVDAQGTNNPINKISIASPTAASLGKYGDIPVNYHTGIPQISIPIYTVSTGPISLPISLSYHASGLKVQEPAGWVGAGWSLNAGGVITRSVMGAPDEKGTNNGATQTHGHYSDYGYNSYVNNSQGFQDWDAFAKGLKDGEPDLYFFNFDGASGKFYFRDDHTPVIVPEADFKIEPYYTGSGSIQGFTITIPNGTKYYFGNTQGHTGTPPIEITKPVTAGNGLSTANTISSWYLNKISSFDDQFSITFSYETENYGYHTLSMFPIDGNTAEGAGSSFGSSHGYDLIKNVIQGVRLSQISFPNGTVNFIASTSPRTDLSDDAGVLITESPNVNAKSLASVQVLSGTILLKKFNFNYSYFTDNSTPLPTTISNFAPSLATDRQRLKLEQVQEISGDNSITIPPYTFSYFNEQLPRRLCFAIDHWGFNNGVTGNTTPIPTYTKYGTSVTTTYPGADRDAYWPAMRAGTLEKITYPTGGYSMFDFEPNSTYSTSTTNSNLSLLSQTIHQFGQSEVTKTGSFTTNGSPMNISFNNSSNYSASYTIVNSSNVTVFSTFIGNGQLLPTNALTLPQGTYQATLTLPSTGLSGGCAADITQWQQVQTTNTIIAGGNRIKTITHNDGVTTNNNITTYNYNGDNGYSSGVIYSKPVYVGIVRNDLLKDVGMWTTSGFQQYMTVNGCLTTPDASYFKSPSSIRPMASTQGSHIGYSQVKVSQAGNGYSVYKYYGSSGVPPWMANAGDVAIRTVNVQGCDANAPSFPYAPIPFDYLRGELQYEANYNEAGQKLKEITYTPTYVNNAVITPCFIASYDSWNNGASTWTLGTRYNLTTAKKTQEQVTETVYNSGGGSLTTTNTTYFESQFHHQATRISTTNSKGETIESKNKYAFDFRLSTCDGIADGYSQYTTDCNSCLTTYNNTITNINCINNSQCLTTAYLNYLQCQTVARTNYVTYRGTYFMNSNNIFKQYHDAAINSADTELKPLLEMQDAFQNPVIESSTWKNSNLLGASFSRYDYGTSPSNKIYPNKTQAINLSTPSSTFTNAVTNGTNNSIIKDNRYTEEANYKMKDGNIVEVTGKDGVVESYAWGHNKAYPTAKVVNAKSNEIFFDGFEETTPGWESSLTAYDNSLKRTGMKSGRLDKPTSGNLVCHNNNWLTVSLTATKKFKFSGWIYTNGPTAELFLVMRRAGETGYYSYLDRVETSTTGKWVYIEKIADVPSDVVVLIVGIVNDGGGTVWFDDVRLHPADALMTTFTYSPLVGLTTQTDFNNRTNYYEYDNLNRLVLIRDHDNNILKKICYNYAGQPENCGGTTYYNIAKSGNFTRTVCAAGGTPGTVTYTVAAGIYNSKISQAAADQLAQDDVNNNGQVYANANGTCTFYNVQKSGSFTRNNCSSSGTTVTYTVNAGTYSSTISQIAADQLAQNDVNNNGQTYANNNGLCLFYSVQKSGHFFKNNCPSGTTASSVTYIVPAGTYTSTTSQAVADQLAQNDVNANGQNYANTNGSCSNPSFSLYYVNNTGEDQYVQLTNATEFFILWLHPNSSGNLGDIPEGNYDIEIWPPGSFVYTYQVGCYYSTAGYGANFYNIPLNASCNYITISPNW